MSFAGFGRSRIPFDMFDLPRTADEARRSGKLAGLYHRGQDLAWDGRKVLADLIARHGGIHIPPDKRAALARIFGVIMWGELAAWKISVQLADELVPLEAKMAATSQGHDEARHFYVMYDYLTALGEVPKSMDRASRVVLDLVLETPSLTKKLLGMQMMVESLALTIFQAVRDTDVEPVLCELLRYYEKDEARHVGLGTQLLPQLLRRLSKREALGLFVFQLQIIGWTLAGLKSLEPAFRTLGIPPQRILTLGRAKQTLAFQSMWDALGVRKVPASRVYVTRTVNGIAEMLFSRGRGRIAAFRAAWNRDLDADLPETSLHPDEAPTKVRLPT
jgi:hypothetical protein